METPINGKAPFLIYIASASQDKELREALENHLAGLVRQKHIHLWHRQQILPGATAQQIQEEQLAHASIILVLMSADFIAECYEEMEQAASRSSSAQVIPILLRDVDFQDTPFERLQCLPRSGPPVADRPSRDQAFREIVSEIRDVLHAQNTPQKKLNAEQERKLRAMIADHRGFMQDRLNSFVGRQSELVEIQQRIEEKIKSGGYVTITGQAGQGKSSIIAKLVEYYGIDTVAFHFIPLNPGPDYQVGLLRSLMARLILKYDLSDLYVASESRAALREYFPKLLTEIAEKGGQEVIFIDGLDQLKEDDNRERDLSFLPDCPPKGIVFVLGTRPNDTLRPLKLLKPHNEYQLPNLSRLDFALILKRRHIPLDSNLADQFYTVMQENALYLDLVAKELAEGATQADEMIAPADMIKRITDDPNSIFSLAMARFKWHHYQWQKVIKPVLGILLAALEPLYTRHIRQILTLEDDELREGLERLGGLITKDGEQHCSLFHLKLHDYLREDEKRPTKEYVFATDEEQSWHKKLAQWCEQTDIWQDIKSSPIEQARREYARWHYVTHLYQAKEWLKLFTVLDSEAYGQAKIRHDPSMRSYVQELNLGRKAAALEEEGMEYGLQFLPQLWQYTLLKCSLTSRADRYPVEAFKALLALQREAEAVGLAEFLTEPDYKAQVLLCIAKHLKAQPHREQESFQFLMRSCEIAKSLVENKRTKILVEVSRELAELNHWERAEEVAYFIKEGEQRASALKDLVQELIKAGKWDDAEKVTISIEKREERISTLRDLIFALMEMQQWERAEVITRTIESSNERDEMLSELGIGLAKTHQWKQAEAVIRTIKNQVIRTNALSGLSFELIEARQWDHAEKIAHSIHPSDERILVLEDLASALIRNQQWEWAEKITQSIESNEEHDKIFSTLASALIKAQRWERAEAIASFIHDVEQRTKILETIVLALLKAQEWERVEEVASLIQDRQVQDRLMGEFAFSLAKEQLWERAEKVVFAIQVQPIKIHTLYALITELSRRQEWKQAETLYAYAETMAEYADEEVRVRALCDLGVALASVQIGKRAEKIWLQAKTLAYGSDRERGRAKLSFVLLAALVKAQEWGRVKTIREEIEKNWQQSDPKEQARALCELWRGLTEAKREEEANNVWEKLRDLASVEDDEEERVNISYEMGIALTKAQEFRQASAIWEEVINDILRIYDLEMQMENLCRVFITLLEMQEWEKAKNVSDNIMDLIDDIDINSIDNQAEFIEVMNKLSDMVDHIKLKTCMLESSHGMALVLCLENYIDKIYQNKQNQIEWEQEVYEASSLQDYGMRAIALCKIYNKLKHLDNNSDELYDEIYDQEYEIQDSIKMAVVEIKDRRKRIKTLKEVRNYLLEIREAELVGEIWEALLKSIDIVEDGEELAWEFVELGTLLAEEEEWELAKDVLVKAEAATYYDITDREKHVKLLYMLVESFLKLDEQQYAERTWQRAEEATQAIQPFTERAGVLITLGTVLYVEQAQEQAELIWKEVDTTARTIAEGKGAQIMAELCTALLHAQYWDWGRHIWQYIAAVLVTGKNGWEDEIDFDEVENAVELDQALIILSMGFIKAMQWDLASEIVCFVSNPQEKAEILQQLGFALCKAQQWDQVKNIWNMVGKGLPLFEENEEDFQASPEVHFNWEHKAKITALTELGVQLHKMHQDERAERVWSEVEVLICTERDGWLKVEMLRNLGRVLAQCRQWQWAKTVAYSISAAWAKAEVLIELSLQFHKARYISSAERSWEEAKTSVQMIHEYPTKAKVLQRLGTMFSIMGEDKRAEEIWDTTEAVIYRISELQTQDKALASFANVLAQAQQWKRATDVTCKIRMSEYKARALIKLGTSLAQAKLWKRSEAAWEEAKKQAYATQDSSERITTLIELGVVLAQTEHLEQAKSICKEIIALGEQNIEYKNNLNLLKNLFALLAMTGLYDQMLNIVQNIWLQVDTREDAIKLLPFGFQLIHLKPEVGSAFYKSFAWVDNLSR